MPRAVIAQQFEGLTSRRASWVVRLSLELVDVEGQCYFGRVDGVT